MWAFTVGECGLDHEKFWDLSWFEWSLYARRHGLEIKRLNRIDETHWMRFRIQWADFRNALLRKRNGQWKATDLIKFPGDEKDIDPKNVKVPDLEKAKKKFGVKPKATNGKQ